MSENEIEEDTDSVEQIETQSNTEEMKTCLQISATNQFPDIAFNQYKVAIIGMNDLGSATAFLLLSRQIITDMIIIDQDNTRLAAEYADLSACTTFVSGVNIQASSQLISCKDARIVILCDIEKDETFSKLKETSHTISLYAPECVLIIAIQPFEIITQICTLNSNLPSYRILAPGTMIDSAHFRLLIGEKLEISPSNITGIMIGSHGHNNLPLWNSVTIGGIHLLSENSTIGTTSDQENWHQLHSNVNQRQEEIRKIKGNEIWSIAMVSSELVECILRNKCEIHPVTVNIKGYYNVKTDLFLSIPAIIGQNGISHLITNSCNENDVSKLLQSV
ncbi:hypothetical protein I4U23_028171 [Adineta vaga]|nr:hypothetical protein I4U23_028171 [Adineta vaga]